MSETGFDPNDPEIAMLMEERARAQGLDLGSPLVALNPDRRVVVSQAEMQRRQYERDDPLGIDDPPPDREWIPIGVPPTSTSWSTPISGASIIAFTDIQQAMAAFNAITVVAADDFDRLASVFGWRERRPSHTDARSSWKRIGAVVGADEFKASAEEAAAVNRRRHGNAAVCPRHGPTKGGLCRRCRR